MSARWVQGALVEEPVRQQLADSGFPLATLLRSLTASDAAEEGMSRASGSGACHHPIADLVECRAHSYEKSCSRSFESQLILAIEGYSPEAVSAAEHSRTLLDRIESILAQRSLVSRIILQGPDRSPLVLIVDFAYMGPSFFAS